MTSPTLRAVVHFSSVRLWRSLVSILLMGALLCLSASALAQPSTADRAEAQKLLVEGQKAASSKDWEGALKAYSEAHAKAPSAATAVRVADAHYELKHTIEAFEAYKVTDAEFGKSLFGADKKRVTDRLAELSQATGDLSIRVDESGAAVTIDGKSAGSSPVPALIRVKTGPHTVKVNKPGYVTFEKEVTIGADGQEIVEVSLQRASTTGKIEVVEKDGRDLRVVIDGVDVGPAPYTGELAPGRHSIEGTSSAMAAASVTAEIEPGKTVRIELEASSRLAQLEIQLTDEKGEVEIDGEVKGEGSITVQLEPGTHTVIVRREGYEDYEKSLSIEAGDVLVETVSLRRATSAVVADGDTGEWSFDGWYGGVRLSFLLIPTGTGNTLDDGCDSLGATSCETTTPIGGGLSGYVGWSLDPVGIELYVAGMADVDQPSASYDGNNSSDINPLVVQPARDEAYTFAKFGGGAALRVRLLKAFDQFRITGALGGGFSIKRVVMGREASTADGLSENFAPDTVGYVAPALSFEVGGQMVLTGTTALTLGLDGWLEHAGDDVSTAAEGDRRLIKEGEIPRPIATPVYKVASGTQFYMGPVLGLQFGP